MGTNFYIKDAMAEEDEDMLHIGKRSCGWAFALRTYPADGIYYLHHWEKTTTKPSLMSMTTRFRG